jgi:hypothetical protein
MFLLLSVERWLKPLILSHLVELRESALVQDDCDLPSDDKNEGARVGAPDLDAHIDLWLLGKILGNAFLDFENRHCPSPPVRMRRGRWLIFGDVERKLLLTARSIFKPAGA